VQFQTTQYSIETSVFTDKLLSENEVIDANKSGQEMRRR
jgi:hypothetical protein